MNKWQMDGNTIVSRAPGRFIDNRNRVHDTIHPGKFRPGHVMKAVDTADAIS